jgi:hypothetical protein
MEHTDAVKLQAVEKYILGELSPTLRDEFEAHFFDCPECSLSLRTAIAFAAGSKQFFAEPSHSSTPNVALERGWFAWLKPVIAVPAFAALLFVIGYQNLVSIPQLKQTSGVTTVDPWFSLATASVHGSAGTRVDVHPKQGFSLFFDITAAPHQPGSTFLLQVQDSAGKTVLTRTVSAKQAQKSVVLYVPGGLPEGDYKLVVLDQSSGSTAQVSELPFAVAFSN